MDISAFLQQLDQNFASQRIDDAERHLLSGLERAEQEGDLGSALTICNELVGFFRVRTQYSRAETYFQKARAVIERLGVTGSESHATTLLNYATMLSAAGQVEKATRIFEEAAGIYAASGSEPYTLAALRNNIASLYYQRGEYSRAMENADAALEQIRYLPDCEDEQGVTHTIRAQILARQGRPEDALRELEEAERCFLSTQANPMHFSAMLLTRGEVLGELERWEESAQVCERAGELVKRVYGRNLSYARILRCLARARKALGQSAAAELTEEADAIQKEYAL